MIKSTKQSKRFIRSTLVCCSLSFLVACVSTPEPDLDSALVPASQREAHQASLSKAKACPMYLAELTDERASKDLLVGNDNVSKDALYSILEQSLLEMNVTPHTNADNSVKVSLERAFVKTLGTNLVATVIIEVQYKPHYADEYSPSVSYRGQSMQVHSSTSINEEHDIAEEAIKEAIAQATRRVKSSLLHECDDVVESANAI